jgi:hypothetical protein
MNLESLVEQLILENLIKIAGPALYYKPIKLLVKGTIGDSHASLYPKLAPAISKKLNISFQKAQEMLDRAQTKIPGSTTEGFPYELLDGFITSEGKFVDRTTAWEIARAYKQNVQQMHAARLGSPGKLASEYL